MVERDTALSAGAERPCTFGESLGPASPDHERIYLEPGNGDPDTGRLWCMNDVWTGYEEYAGMQATEYVRADLVAAGAEREARLRAALEPFARLEMPHQEPDHWPAFGKQSVVGWPTVGDFRRARAALSDTPAPASGTARLIEHDQATALMHASTLPSSDCEEIVGFLNKAGFAIVSTEAPASGTGTRVDGLEEAARWHDGRAKSQRALVALSRADRDFQTAALDENSEIVHRNSAAAIRALASREPGREEGA